MKARVRNESELLDALLCRVGLEDAVPPVLDLLEREPLASAGRFRGDLLRALIDLPSAFWSRRAALFRRYQAVVRAGALERRELPVAEQMAFWTEIGTWRRAEWSASAR